MLRSLLAVLAIALAAATTAAAQPWPNKSVKVIVPYAPGGSTDNAARAFADKLSTRLGQQFVVDNRGGAAGAIGVEAGAKSPPDGEAIQDFLAGNVHSVHESNTMPLAKTGKAKMLAVIDTERHPDFPDVPTLAEAVPGYDVVNWFGMAGPAGVPAEIVQKLGEELNAIAGMEDVRARLLPLGLRPIKDKPADMAANVRKEYDRYQTLVTKLNIKLE
jgi:tripartite-type tricarboxylate transporter receptor subunit TctC